MDRRIAGDGSKLIPANTRYRGVPYPFVSPGPPPNVNVRLAGSRHRTAASSSIGRSTAPDCCSSTSPASVASAARRCPSQEKGSSPARPYVSAFPTERFTNSRPRRSAIPVDAATRTGSAFDSTRSSGVRVTLPWLRKASPLPVGSVSGAARATARISDRQSCAFGTRRTSPIPSPGAISGPRRSFELALWATSTGSVKPSSNLPKNATLAPRCVRVWLCSRRTCWFESATAMSRSGSRA